LANAESHAVQRFNQISVAVEIMVQRIAILENA
jgi:hypothetical protein